MSLEVEEDKACDFLHIGSGWSKSAYCPPTKIVGDIGFSRCEEKQPKNDQILPSSTNGTPSTVDIKAFKLAGRNSQGRGSNRATPYSARSMRDRNAESSHRQGEGNAISIARNKQVAAQSVAASYKQSDFENLSLGPGCPWLDAMDLHI